MKITRRQLRQIIKEEISILSESPAIDKMFGGSWNSYDMDEKLEALADMILYNHEFVNTFEDEFDNHPWVKLKDLEDKVEKVRIGTSQRIKHHSHKDDEDPEELAKNTEWSGKQAKTP